MKYSFYIVHLWAKKYYNMYLYMIIRKNKKLYLQWNIEGTHVAAGILFHGRWSKLWPFFLGIIEIIYYLLPWQKYCSSKGVQPPRIPSLYTILTGNVEQRLKSFILGAMSWTNRGGGYWV